MIICSYVYTTILLFCQVFFAVCSSFFMLKSVSCAYSAITLYASMSFSRGQRPRFAALVDGRQTAGMFVSGKHRVLYSFHAVLPVVYMRRMCGKIRKSFGFGSFMEASFAPDIRHECKTSHKAMPWRKTKARFCSTVSGTGSEKTAASTGQKRFCPCP